MSETVTGQTGNDRPRVVLLGVGRWGKNHLRVLRESPVELYCVDTDPAQLDKLVESGIDPERVGSDPYAFLPRVDCALIATPAQSHYDLCRRYLEADKDVFVEKPLTLEADDSRKLAELAQERQRILQVGHIFRFDPAARWLRDEIAMGRFGNIKILRGNFSGFKRPRNDSGVTFADAIHFVDLFNMFLGRPPVRVTAVLNDFLERGMDDESWISMEYEIPGHSGASTVWATVETGYHTPGKFRQVQVLGDRVSALCDFNISQYKVTTHTARHEVSEHGIVAVEETSQQLEFPPVEPLQAEVRAFLESVQTRAPADADGWAGYWSVRVVQKALESAAAGRTLELES
jgi:predicted dehydrogenase